MRLTEAGSYYANRCLEIVQLAADANDATHDVMAKPVGILRIKAHPVRTTGNVLCIEQDRIFRSRIPRYPSANRRDGETRGSNWGTNPLNVRNFRLQLRCSEKRIRRVATNLIDYIEGNICPRMALEEMVRGGSDG